MPESNNDDASALTTPTAIQSQSPSNTTPGRGSTSNAGRGRGGRNSGARGRSGRGNRSRRQRSGPKHTQAKIEKFVGETPALAGHGFHTTAEKPKRTEWTTTLTVIQTYCATQYKSQYKYMRKTLFEDFDEPAVTPIPVRPEDINDAIAVKEYLEDYKVYKNDVRALNDTMESLFDVVLGQCSSLMKTTLKSMQGYQDMRDDSHVWALLRAIKGITHQFQSNISPYEALDEAKRQYYTYSHNNDNMAPETYVKMMKSMVDTIQYYGGSIGDDEALIHYEREVDPMEPTEDITEDDLVEIYKERAQQKMLAVGILRRADKRHFSHILRSLRNEFQLGRDSYPANYTRALDLLQHFHSHEVATSNPGDSTVVPDVVGTGTQSDTNTNAPTEDVQFYQHNSVTEQESEVCTVVGTNGIGYSRITCYYCKQKGHYADFCPVKHAETNKKPAPEEKPSSSPLPVTKSILKKPIIKDKSQVKPVSAKSSPTKKKMTSPITALKMPKPVASLAHPSKKKVTIVPVQNAQMDKIELAPDAAPPEAPSYDSDDSLDADWVFQQSVYDDPALNNCLLLDTGSSVNTFGSAALVTNIRPADTALTTRSTGGSSQYTEYATFLHFLDVWYDADCLVNILSFHSVQQHFRITTDTAVESGIHVHISDGITLRFLPYKGNIYLLDPPDYAKLNSAITSYSCTNIVAKNKVNFTKREIEGADKARALYKAMRLPQYKTFIKRLAQNQIKDCKVTVADAQRAHAIYGPELAYNKGHFTHSQPKHVSYDNFLEEIPRFILQYHSSIILFMDFFYVNDNAFLHSISQGYKFRTGEATGDRNKTTMTKCIMKILRQYGSRGIKIKEIRTDGEFNCVRDEVPCHVNITAPNEHVPEIERSIRTIKEGSRTTCHDLPYEQVPKLMTRGNIYCEIIHLNDFPPEDGVSDTMSPATLIAGRPPPTYDELMKVSHGSYVHAYTETKNDETARAVGAIALYPCGNTQGGWYFMSLKTGKRIKCYKWTVAPICDQVIKRVHQLAEREKGKTTLTNGQLEFKWRPDQDEMIFDSEEDTPIRYENNEYDIVPTIQEIPDDYALPITLDEMAHPDIEQEDNSNQPDEIENLVANNGIQQENPSIKIKERTSAPTEHNTKSQTKRSGSLVMDLEEVPYGTVEDVHDEEEEENLACSDQVNILPNEDIIEENDPPPLMDRNTPGYDSDDDDDEDEVEATTSENLRSNNYNLRNKQKVDYKDARTYAKPKLGSQYIQLAKELYPEVEEKNKHIRSSKKRAKTNRKQHKLKIQDTYKSLVALVFTQMSAKKGIKKHGEAAIQVILKEFKQLHDLSVFIPRHKDELNQEQLDLCLRLITMIKEKRNGNLKGRACADGRTQRGYIPKDESTSPTVSLDALLLSLMCDAYEERDVATADVAGAFLKALMDDFVLVKLIDHEVDIMCKVDSNYEQYVVQEGKHKVLYMQLHKALYGTIKAAILWYETFVETLEGEGFKLNPYDPCVANKDVDGDQCTIAWYVDDNKISHKDTKVVDEVIAAIEKKHGKMTVKRGKKHVFVGIGIEFTDEKTVKIMMKDYITESIEQFEQHGDTITKGPKTPAANTLFNTDDNSPMLDEKKAETFHSVVAKLLFVSMRARLDVALPIAFLTTRVTKSNEQDWLKLKRVLRYLLGTIDMPRIIGANSLKLVRCWVDASYAIHHDMRSHTGGVISFGKGVTNVKTKRQNLNTKSSTEAEVVGASDYIPWLIWTIKFMKYQGYDIDKKIFYQDNQSAMKLEQNGRKSCGQKSRHIDIRYFFIKDVLRRENIDLQHCPTEEMIADFYTKPLQGALFERMRNFIMGLDEPSSEERVGENGLFTSIGPVQASTVPNQFISYADAARKAIKRNNNDQ